MEKQRTPFDCGIATLANTLSISYAEALNHYGQEKQTQGVSIQQTASILFALGYSPIYIPFQGFAKASGIAMQTASPTILETLGHPAILQVLTTSGQIHQVFFDGKKIHDPAPHITHPKELEDYDCVDALFVIKNSEALGCKKAFDSPVVPEVAL